MSRKSYHVTPHPEGGWQVKSEGSNRASSKHETKNKAVAAGRKLARKKSSQMFIHGRNGKIQEERTYGKDPFPPEG